MLVSLISDYQFSEKIIIFLSILTVAIYICAPLCGLLMFITLYFGMAELLPVYTSSVSFCCFLHIYLHF